MKRTALLGLTVTALVATALSLGCVANEPGAKEEPSQQESVDPAPAETVENTQDDTSASAETTNEETRRTTMNIQVGGTTLTATLVDNSSTEALRELLADGPLTINMSDYGNMEKVGSFGTSLPRNDQQITTEPGDLILYQGSAFVIYYAPNSWSFTRLGRIDGVSAAELKQVLGGGDVSVTLSLD